MCADGTQRLGCRTNDWVHVFHIRRKFRSRVVINVNVSCCTYTKIGFAAYRGKGGFCASGGRERRRLRGIMDIGEWEVLKR